MFESDLLGRFAKELDDDELDAIKDESQEEEEKKDLTKEEDEDTLVWESKE